MAILAQNPSLRREVFFLDATLTDIATLTSSLPANAGVYLIDPLQDGLEQIALVLQGRSGIDAIHLFSHGSASSLLLGSTTLSSLTINGYAATLAQIGSSLSPTGDILLYGCNVGAGAEGQAFVEWVARLTQADVAASDDVTGSAALGGDWVLEVQSGDVDAAAVSMEAYAGVLENIAPTFTALSTAVNTTNEDSTVLITFAELATQGDEADADGTVDAFVVKALSSGKLRIGTAAASATNWNATTHNTIDATHNAWWTPALNANGSLDAFTVVAKDNSGVESATAVQATVSVTAVNDLPVIGRSLFLSMAAKVDYTVGDAPVSVIFADVNGDSKADLVVVNEGSDNVSVLLNNGDSTFAPKVDYAVGDAPRSVTALEVNGDGKLDLVVANWNSDTVSVLLNSDYGTFGAIVDYVTGDQPCAVISADVNGDRKADLVVVNYYSATVSVLMNNADGTFAAKVDYATGAAPGSIVSADVDGDGKLDLAVANWGSNSVSVLINNGNGTFAEQVDYTTGIDPWSVASTDVNGDGKLDLVVANWYSDSVSVLMNNGDGTFAAKEDYAVGDAPRSVTTVDVNGDGKADLVVANEYSDKLSLLINRGDGTFLAAVDYAAGDAPKSVAGRDLEGDGKLDIVVANYNSDSVSVLINTSQAAAVATPFIEQTPVRISNDIIITDIDGNASWNGGSLKLQITANAEAADSLSLATANPGSNGIWLDVAAGNKLMAGATHIGTASSSSVSNGAALTLTFNTSATNLLVQDVARAIIFNNSSNTPGTAERTVTFTATDCAGAAETLAQHITVNSVNELPTLTAFSAAIDTMAEDRTVEITFAELAAKGDEADSDGSVTAFVVKHLNSGILKIGANATVATPFDGWLNNTIDTTNNAYWTPAHKVSGTLNAFTTVARDNSVSESTTAVQATVTTTAVHDAPVLLRPLSFAARTDYGVPLNAYYGSVLTAITSENVNGDGTADLVVLDDYYNGSWCLSYASVFLNNGNGAFSRNASYLTVSNSRANTESVLLTDVNDGGGKYDIVAVNHGTDTIAVLINNGDGSFSERVEYAVGDGPYAACSADINGDGYTDVMVVNEFSNTVSVLMNKGDGTLAAKVDYATGDSPRSVLNMDINNDGKADLVVANANSNTVSMWLNKGDGTFLPRTDYVTDDTPRALTVVDVNSDGLMDLVVANQRNDTVSVFMNNGNGGFLPKVNYVVGDGPYAVTSADLNGDGYADLAATNYYSNTISVLLNRGDGTFAAKVDFVVGDRPVSITSADMNGDGLADLAVVNQGSNNFSVLLSTLTSATQFTEQTPVAVCDDLVLLSPEGDASLNGGSLTVQISTNANADDSLVLATSNLGGSGIWLDIANGNKLMASNVAIGLADAASASDDTSWTFTFNASATNELVQSVARAVTFVNNSNNPSALDRTVTLTATDSLGATTSIGQIIKVTPVIDVPTFTAFSNPVDATTEDNAVEVTFAELLAKGDEAGEDGTVTAFVVKAVSSGSLKIGADAATATAWNASNNAIVDATHRAWWAPAADANGTLNAFTAVARDNGGTESVNPIQATINVDSVNDVPEITIPSTTTFAPPTPVAVVPNIVLSDRDGDASWNAGTLKLHMSANANAADSLTLATVNPGGTGIWLNTTGNKLMAGTTEIGAADAAAGSHSAAWTLTFNANATTALVQQVAREVTFSSSATPVAGERTITVTLTDNAGASATLLQKVNELPVLTAFTAPVEATTEEIEVEITFAELTAKGNESDDDGSVTGFVVKTVGNGTLRLGTDVISATPFTWGSNNTINATHHAYWTPAHNANGTLNAFTMVAQDSSGTESATALAAQVSVAAVNDAPLLQRLQALSFATKVDYVVVRNPVSIVSSDPNSTGKADLIVGSNYCEYDYYDYRNNIAVLRNQGEGIFAASTYYATSANPNSATSADFNGDGNPDLAVANYGSSTVSVMIGSWASRIDYPAGDGARWITGGDFNGDGKLDLATVNYGAASLSVLINKGDGTFATKVDYTVGSAPQGVISIDVNGDGKLDLIAVNCDSDTISVLKNRGDGTFEQKVDYAVGDQPKQVSSADFNGEGALDLVVTNYESDTVTVLMNNGSGTFIVDKTYVTGDAPLGVVASDLNGDGHADLAVANALTDNLSVLLNNGNGSFAPKNDYTAGDGPWGITSADMNHDGKLDLAVANQLGNTVSVFLNTSQALATRFMEQTPVTICNDIAVSDPEGDASWNGGVLKVQITGNAAVDDALSIATSNLGGNAVWLDVASGNKLMAGTTHIGTASAASASNGAAWTFTFNSSATGLVVQSVARALIFNNSSDTPGAAERTITFTATDNAGASASLAQPISVTLVNKIPTMTAFTAPVDTTSEESVVCITTLDLAAKGDEADRDGFVDAYVIKSLSSGTLRIGADAASARAWSAVTNNTIDATHHAWWTPDANSNGTLNAFTAVARDNDGGTSTTAVQATVMVASVNDLPVVTRSLVPSFAAKVDYATGSHPYAVISRDSGGNGKADLWVANYDSTNVSLLLNKGDSTFAPAINTATGNGSRAMTSADFNGDGVTDLAVANYTANTISVLSGGMNAKVDVATGTRPTSIVSADMNHDGLIDLVTANQDNDTVSLLLNKGDGTFAAKVDFTTGNTPQSVIAVDVNNDGWSDLVTANQGQNTISVLINKGKSTFETKVDYATGGTPQALTTGDFNGDGRMDLAVTNTGDDSLSILLNNGNGVFAVNSIYAAGDAPLSITSADINGDGKADLAVANYNSDTVSVFVNNGDGTFAAKTDFTTGDMPTSITATDINGDGKVDLAITNYNVSTVSVLINTSKAVEQTSFARKTAVSVASDMVITDADGNAGWNGGTLKAQITANAEAVDSLNVRTTNPGGSGIWLNTASGNKLMAGNTEIGSANAGAATNADLWTFTFNSRATGDMVQSVARALTFTSNSEATDTADRTITITATDNSGQSGIAVLHHSDAVLDSEFGTDTGDVIAPMLDNFVQSDAHLGIAVDSNLELIFNEAIQHGSGLIAIHRDSVTGSVVESFDAATSADIAIAGNKLTINPAADLDSGTHYFVTFDTTAINDMSGNSYAGNDICHVKTEIPDAAYHNLTGGVTFWKNNAAVSDVTTTLTSQQATQLVELRNIHFAADGSRTLEIWATSPSTTVNSLQLEFVLPAGSKASWQSGTALPADWTLLANTERAGQFILGGMSTTAMPTGGIKLGTLALTATTNPEHDELLLSKGFIGHDIVPGFGVWPESVTSTQPGLYEHLDTLQGDYTLTGAKITGRAESNAINANDALAALKMAVAINPNADGSSVSPYQFLAADVNKDGIIRSTDALNILKMAVKLSSAPVSEWLFVSESTASAIMDRNMVDWSHVIPTVTLDHDVELDLIGIVKGDVDGSWVA
ncbi:MAG: FG-GAP-like repeat-containing protein [Chlorobium sp.]